MTLVEGESPVVCKALDLMLSHPMTPSRQQESHRTFIFNLDDILRYDRRNRIAGGLVCLPRHPR